MPAFVPVRILGPQLSKQGLADILQIDEDEVRPVHVFLHMVFPQKLRDQLRRCTNAHQAFMTRAARMGLVQPHPDYKCVLVEMYGHFTNGYVVYRGAWPPKWREMFQTVTNQDLNHFLAVSILRGVRKYPALRCVE